MNSCTVITPCGSFVAAWSLDDEEPVSYSGSFDAINFFRQFLIDELVTGVGGRRIEFESVEPDDLRGFCDLPERGIVVEQDFAFNFEEAAPEAVSASAEASGLLAQLNESQAVRKRLADLLPMLDFDSEEDRDAFIEAAGLDAEAVFDAIGGPPVAHADESVLPMDQPLAVILKAAQEYAIKSFAGKRVTNASDGSEIMIDKGGIIHGLSARAGLTDALVATDLQTLLRMATFMRKEPDRKGRTEILAAYRYGAVVEVQGKSVQVGVIVREHKDGKRYYDHYELKPRNP